MATKHEVDSRWEERPVTPTYIHHAKRFSGNKFIIVPKARHYDCLQDTSIFIFNAANNTFSKLCDIDYSNDTIHSHRGNSCHGPDFVSCDIKHNENDKRIYITSLQYNKFIKVMLNGKTTNIEDPLSHGTNHENNIFRTKGAYVLIGHILHVIGGKDHNNHVTYDTFYGEITEKYRFGHDCLQDAQALYVKSKDSILLIGGHSGSYNRSQAIKQRRWSGIKKYDLKQEIWSDVAVSPRFNYANVHAVLTSDEKHIIVTPYGKRGNVMVIDIANDDKYTLRETNIALPYPVPHDIVRIGVDSDKLIVNGYVRQSWLSFDARDEFKVLEVFPLYLVEHIQKYFNVEEIHWVARGSACRGKNTNHYCITLNNILTGFDKDE